MTGPGAVGSTPDEAGPGEAGPDGAARAATRPGAAGEPPRLVLGVDSGGSGLRVALAPVGAREAAVTASARQPVRTGPGGIDAAHLRELLLPLVRGLPGPWGGDVRPAAVVIGAAGLATLGDRLRAELPGALEADLGVRRLGLAADAVTAYAGALGQAPGVVVAAGTGMIALGTDLRTWRRADGWGHLLGDCGGGAWIGRAGLEAALRAHDDRSGGSRALLERMEAVFGPAASLPGLLYPRSDRPAVLASFAPEVARCAAAGDTVAAGIMARAAGEIADTAAAAAPVGAGGPDRAASSRARTPGDERPPGAHAGHSGGPEADDGVRGADNGVRGADNGVRGADNGVRVAVTGGLTRTGEALTAPLRAALAQRLPGARLVPAAGDPLTGALLLAEALATDSLRLPPHPSMLHLYDGTGR